MLEVIYHNLANVHNMFKSKFKIDFPYIAELSKAVNSQKIKRFSFLIQLQKIYIVIQYIIILLKDNKMYL